MGVRQRQGGKEPERLRFLGVPVFVSPHVSFALSFSPFLHLSFSPTQSLCLSLSVTLPVCLPASLFLSVSWASASVPAQRPERPGRAVRGRARRLRRARVKELGRGTERSERGGGSGGSGLSARGGDRRGECLRVGSGGAESEVHRLQGWQGACQGQRSAVLRIPGPRTGLRVRNTQNIRMWLCPRRSLRLFAPRSPGCILLSGCQ